MPPSMASLVTFATASPVPSSRQVYAFCVDDGGVDVEADGVRFFPPFRHARHFDLLLLVTSSLRRSILDSRFRSIQSASM
jgi:hypothetical protein